MGVVDWLFRDRTTGRIAVAQRPNAPLAVWLLLIVVDAVASPEGTARTVLRAGSVVALGWWAVDEVVRGVNPLRRILGGAVLAGLVAAVIGLR